MSENGLINPAVLEPLFGPSDVPDRHRVRGKSPGSPAEVIRGRRPSPVLIVQNLRRQVAEWRETDYSGASDTTRELLHHWFGREHEVVRGDGVAIPFRYYFCQREAIETLIYLYEVRGIRTVSTITAEFGGPDSERAALGVSPDEDMWAKYAFKVATGAGKTKIMSLAVVWSYFHALRESDSPLAKHFLVVAPGITVFERLREDFADGRIFDSRERDPLIPTAWLGDWNMSVVLQDEAGGATAGGTIYLTNIHRLYEPSNRSTREKETYSWMGPPVSKSKALDTAAELRERITSHSRLMVLNDEAHHVWDPGSAWNEAITTLNETTRKRAGGLVAQLDFSATPKDNKGNLFRHIICDTPLGEAVDAGIVKTPVIGHGEQLVERAHGDAAYRYENHLMLGYHRWLRSREEWEKSGKKPLLFVMTESTDAADQITTRLNRDLAFKELNGTTINLHTNLKGRLKPRGKGATRVYDFIPEEKAISDDDLKALRKLARELDNDTSPYQCIVSVLMLREGWDVRNVTTIVPLRPLTAKSKILPEQTLGRGLRRMTPPGMDQAAEVVTVVEHKAFLNLYREELSQEGLPIEAVDIDQVPRTTVTIYPDAEHKDLEDLDLLVPRLSSGYRTEALLEELTFDEVREAFRPLSPLPLGEPREQDIQYEGRHLITDELVERMRIKLPLLADGIGAISFFREELERATRLRGLHPKLAPLIQLFLEEVLFEERVTLYDPRLVARLADADVREHVRATFVHLLLAKSVKQQERIPEIAPQSVSSWKPFQATHSERHPTELATKTPFNLVPCNRELEVAMTHYLDRSSDVAAFAKNAGPQALRIDYLTIEGQRASYTADFLIRKTNGHYLLLETKGRSDREVPGRARAAVEWCRAASTTKVKWQYVFVLGDLFERITGNSIEDLSRACAPALAGLLRESESRQLTLGLQKPEAELARFLRGVADPAAVEQLPARYRRAVEHAITLFQFHEKKESTSFAPIFQPLLGPLDHAAEAILVRRLSARVPSGATEQRDFFDVDFSGLKRSDAEFLADRARSLRRLLVHRSPLMPVGMLAFCIKYAHRTTKGLGGIFAAIRVAFADLDEDLQAQLETLYNFRNTYIAHQKEELTDMPTARDALRSWILVLLALHSTP